MLFGTSEMEVRDIGFIGRELCAFHSKPIVYLHYIVQREKLIKRPGSTYPSLQYVLKRYPCDDKLSDEGIVEAFVQMMNSPMSVTQKVKFLVFVKQFQLEYPSYLDDVETYPNYKVTLTNISNGSSELPDKAIVWDLNHICPELCGMFFENMIAGDMDHDEILSLKDCMLDFNDNTTECTIITMLKHSVLKPTVEAKIIKGNIVLANGTESIADCFRSRYHMHMFSALKHFWKYSVDGKWYEYMLSMLEYITTNMVDIEAYDNAIQSSTTYKVLRREYVSHGEYLRIDSSDDKLINGLHGETDFSSNTTIADCKVQKDPTEEKWFAQLYLYKRMIEHMDPNKHITKLFIIDLYDNKLYSYAEA